MHTKPSVSKKSRLSRDRVLHDVKKIVGEQVCRAPEEIREQDRLVADLACDSLDVVEITMEVEEHFDVTVPDNVDQATLTVGDIADGVLQLLGQGEPGGSSAECP